MIYKVLYYNMLYSITGEGVTGAYKNFLIYIAIYMHRNYGYYEKSLYKTFGEAYNTPRLVAYKEAYIAKTFTKPYLLTLI